MIIKEIRTLDSESDIVIRCANKKGIDFTLKWVGDGKGDDFRRLVKVGLRFKDDMLNKSYPVEPYPDDLPSDESMQMQDRLMQARALNKALLWMASTYIELTNAIKDADVERDGLASPFESNEAKEITHQNLMRLKRRLS